MTRDEFLEKSQIDQLTGAIQCELNKLTLARLHIKRAHKFKILGERVKSIEDYMKALELADVLSDICHIKAMVSLALLESSEKEQAMWWAVGAKDCDPSSPEGHFAFGLNCSFCDFQNTAIEAFRSVLKIGSSPNRVGDFGPIFRFLAACT